MSEYTLPDLEFRCPDCPLCGNETNSVDDWFDCEWCNLTWDKRGTHGQRQDPQRPQCTAECAPHDEKSPSGGFRWPFLAGNRYRCALDADHVEQEIPHRGMRIDKPDLGHDTHEWPSVAPVTT